MVAYKKKTKTDDSGWLVPFLVFFVFLAQELKPLRLKKLDSPILLAGLN